MPVHDFFCVVLFGFAVILARTVFYFAIYELVRIHGPHIKHAATTNKIDKELTRKMESQRQKRHEKEHRRNRLNKLESRNWRDKRLNEMTQRDWRIFKEEFGLDGKSYKLNPIQKLEKVGGLSSIDKAVFDDVYREYAENVPIHKRVTKQEIELLLDREFDNRSIDIDYEYGIYSRGLPAKVKSKWFKYSKSNIYKAPVFKDSEGQSDFYLLLTFPKKKKFLISLLHLRRVVSLDHPRMTW